jgi:hypothetical protein
VQALGVRDQARERLLAAHRPARTFSATAESSSATASTASSCPSCAPSWTAVAVRWSRCCRSHPGGRRHGRRRRTGECPRPGREVTQLLTRAQACRRQVLLVADLDPDGGDPRRGQRVRCEAQRTVAPATPVDGSDPVHLGRCLSSALVQRARHWYYKAELPGGPDGRRKRARRGGYATRREAEAALTDLPDRINKRIHVNVGRWAPTSSRGWPARRHCAPRPPAATARTWTSTPSRPLATCA